MTLREPLIAAVIVVLGTLVGCEGGHSAADSSTTGTVGILDLDAIAKQLGSDKAIADSIARQTSSLNQELHQLAKSYHAQISEQRQAIAQHPDEDRKVNLAAYEEQAHAGLSKARKRVQTDIARYRAQLIQGFRDEIRPTVRRIANQRGLSIVVTKNDSVIYDYGAAVDLTESVLQALMANSSQRQNQSATRPNPATTQR